ncbi:MAG: alpha/beta hydrolase [Dehalococcoidia bacterium]|nr:alpha/beta hydrolase [Dehalococcoidia bacterium]
MIEPLARRIPGDGVTLQVYEWPGEDPPILLVHATGFHARCWDQVVARLPGRRVVALDMRGHGLSEKPEPPYSWRSFGGDVAAVCRALGLRGAIGVGHSKGGHAVTLAAALAPGTFTSLLLIDPVILEPRLYRGRPQGGEHFAARRRDRWASPAEMFDRFRSRPPFATWEPAVLRDYCDYGLVPAPDGDGYVLACPPRIEAAVYTSGGSDADIYDEIAAIDIPVRIIRARQREAGAPGDMSRSPTYPGLVRHFPNAEDLYLPDYSHFIPMEAPTFVAGQVLERIAALGDTCSV